MKQTSVVYINTYIQKQVLKLTCIDGDLWPVKLFIHHIFYIWNYLFIHLRVHRLTTSKVYIIILFLSVYFNISIEVCFGTFREMGACFKFWPTWNLQGQWQPSWLSHNMSQYQRNVTYVLVTLFTKPYTFNSIWTLIPILYA